MINLILNNTEKNRILSLHKKMIKEQAANTNQSPVGKTPAQIAGMNKQSTESTENEDLSKIRYYERIGCLSNGETLANKDYTKYIYRVIANNVKYDYYADGTYKASNGETGRYSCQDYIDKYNLGGEDEKIETTRSSKWLTADKTGATQEELNNPSMWEKKKFSNGSILYRSKAAADTMRGTTTEQKQVIDSWTGETGNETIWKTADNLTLPEIQVAYKLLASPKSDGVFNTDFYVYAKQSDIDGGLSQNTCNKLINQFFDDWNKNIRKTNGIFAQEKLKVERCATMFKNRRIFGIGNTDENLKVLKGEARGGRSNTAPDKYSRFRLFNNVYQFDNK